LFSFAGTAQNHNGIIKGFVYDKKSGEPLIYTNVSVVNAKTGVQTDVNGYFSLSLPSGSYTLMTTALGYDSSVISVNLLPDAIVSKKILLAQREVGLKEIEVSGRKTEKTTHINTGVTNITPRDLKLLPSSGGEPDVAQYLQVIPGVVFTGDQGGQLYIRGGSPVQTGIYLDGVTIYSPFHSIGLFSVFETEAIRNVDVYTAGFSAQYGNRTSAIVDVHYKDGNKNETEGIVSVSPIMSRFLLDGPIFQSKKHSGAGATYLLTAKSSYLDQTSKSLYSSLGSVFERGLPYKFTDIYGKLTFSGDNGSKLNVFGFNFNDEAKLLNDSENSFNPVIADYRWQATGAGATFVVSPGNSSSLIDGKFAYSNYNISVNGEQHSNVVDTLPGTSQINGFEAAINFTYFLPNYSQLKYGVEVSGTHTSLSYYNGAGIGTTEERQSTMAALYFLFRQNFNSRFILEPSIRFQYYSELNKLSPEPRIGMKYNITDNVRLKGAAGIYSQNIIGTKSDQDIVNLFTGFLLSPDQQITDPHGNIVKSNLQTAYHLVGGIEVDVQKVEFNLEPWVKYFGQVDELNRNKLFVQDPDFIAASGLANGVDISAKYSYGRIYLWGAAGYQNVNYTSIDSKGKIQTYPTPFDTRFNSNVVVSYTAGKKKDWDVSARYNIHSPFPFTQTQGFYENLAVPTPNTNILQQNGSLGVIYANQINGGRLSWYHRLDISVKKRFKLSKKSSLDATFAITNLYDRNNVFYVNRVTNVIIYQLPLFPSLNITWNF
ncbi:MAG: carboxypeptidase-like regulatory domain-containing protein, partial [Chitinophagales bacterium]